MQVTQQQPAGVSSSQKGEFLGRGHFRILLPILFRVLENSGTTVSIVLIGMDVWTQCFTHLLIVDEKTVFDVNRVLMGGF
jgi:hypothetical protein